MGQAFKDITQAVGKPQLSGLWHDYKLRWKRRRFLLRAWRKRHQIKAVVDRSDLIANDAIISFTTVRNEMVRLPYFLNYYRALGVGHFFFVDNGSDDGTTAYLRDQPDVSLWQTDHSYKLSRFGVDWLAVLQRKYAHGHWTLTVDADELLVFPHHDTRGLRDLTAWLDTQKQRSLATIMIDMYPKGPLDQVSYEPGDDPIQALPYFDHDNCVMQRHAYYGNYWIQGGVRARVYFQDEPMRAPTLNKFPLVKWDRRFAYVNSTHQILPAKLHRGYDPNTDAAVTGALLHTKFLPIIAEKSQEELQRRQHFENSDLYTTYHHALAKSPDLWCATSQRYAGWPQLVEIGLISAGQWR